MDFRFSGTDIAFRQEVREFFADHLPADLKAKTANAQALSREDIMRWHGILYEKGWVAPNWPEEYGGPGWSVTEKYIFDEEQGLAAAPRLIQFGLGMCGPVIMAFGTPEQRAFHLPRMLSGEHVWAQGYSEPGAGSDLASLTTRARLEGDEWVINGRKLWTTQAHMANWVFLLARTSDEPKKQLGISFFLIPLDTLGITIRPIHLLDGLHETNEVLYEDVRIPAANLVGNAGEGWTIAKHLLAHERMGGGALGQHKLLLAQVKALAASDQRSNGRPLTDDPSFSRRIATLETELRALEAVMLKTLAKVSADKALGAEANVIKIRGTEVHQRLTELRMEALGADAMPYDLDALENGWGNRAPVGAAYANGVTPRYLHMRKVSIYSGSNEIQHNIYAKAVLGL
jgi:alkylation response protein AidB-like acyl-CoA dehydrogenase